MTKARSREEGYLSTIRYKDQVIEQLKQSIQQGGGVIPAVPSPPQDDTSQKLLSARNLELEGRVVALEEGLRKAMRYNRSHCRDRN